jgi:hypothetical protein
MSSEAEAGREPGARARLAWARRAATVVLLLVICAAGYQVVRQWPRGPGPVPAPQPMAADDFIDRLIQVSDATPVIGVTTAGRSRAYVLRALRRPDTHVYNDLLGKVPVTVTYCDLDDCVRVFTSPDCRRPLDVAAVGPDPHHARKMLLRVGEQCYCQETGLPPDGEGTSPFPYADSPFVRTTWGEWRAAHPDTDIYVGKLPFRPKHSRLPLAFPPGEED